MNREKPLKGTRLKIIVQTNKLNKFILQISGNGNTVIGHAFNLNALPEVRVVEPKVQCTGIKIYK